ncbi:MAG TPA: sulfite exporter TauE/SafE family protein, partial [Nitrososphaera sp.]|nr:sulfite exporter TauE/SafE family protein [Nitrososphaera sp.]
AILSDYLSTDSFKLFFGILLMLSGLYILYKNSILKERKKEIDKIPAHLLPAVFGASFGAGIISSLFGVGGGIIFVPVMLLILGMAMQRAAPTSQLILMITSMVGVLTHVFLGHADYLGAIALSAGAFVGAQIGARLSRSVKDTLLQKILGLVLIGVAVKFIFDWFAQK